MKQYIPEKRGALMTTTGEKIGEHHGAQFYTIGQRHIDAEFSFPKTGSTPGGAARQPFYVASKDAATNIVVVAEGSDNEALYAKKLTLVNLNFISNTKHNSSQEVYARVRYRQPVSKAMLSANDDGTYTLAFSKPQKFVAQGQSAVLYTKAGEMLGGGVIL